MINKHIDAAFLIIGDEVLSGRTREGNLHVLAGFLAERGVSVSEVRVIRDDQSTIIAHLNELRKRNSFVFTSGGIGPTHDDITAESVAAAFETRITVRDDARAILEDYYGDRINEARLRMARIPDGAALIDNPVSAAPGFRIENVFVLAGVPRIFEAMLGAVGDQIAGGARVRSVSLTAAVAEGDIAGALAEAAARHPDVSIGCYPFMRGALGVTVVARSTDEAALTGAASDLKVMFRVLGATVKEMKS